MDPLNFAVDDIFTDPLLASAATWHPAGGADGVAVRAFRRAPDQINEWNGARLVVGSVLLEVRTSDAPTLREGDRIEIGAEMLEIIAEPRRSTDGTVFEVEAKTL